MAAHPTVFSLLVTNPDDVLAALAYAAYKQHEVETMAEILSRTGTEPTADDVAAFERSASTAAGLAMYEERAETLMQTFLSVTLAARESALVAEFTNTAVGQQLLNIQNNQKADKTFMGWARDVTGNLMVNLVTILIIGSLVIGYKKYEDWSGNLGKNVSALVDEKKQAAPADKTTSDAVVPSPRRGA